MRKQFITIILILSINSIFAKELPEWIRVENKQNNHTALKEPTYHHKLNQFQKYGDVEKRSYDVLNYDYSVNLLSALKANLSSSREARKGFFGSNNITIAMLETTNELEFDAANMTIDSVIIYKNSIETILPNTNYTVVNNILKVQSPTELNIGDSLIVRIVFSAIADDELKFGNNRGLHIYHKGYYIKDKDKKGDSISVDHNIAYSMSEPELARYWMPCNDRPYDKATSSVSVTVPLGYNVASNGYIVSIDTLQDNRVIYHWKNDYPIATYLMCFASSIFDEYHQTAIVNGDTIPIVHYAWPEDMNGDYFKLIPSMDTEPQMFDILINHYGPYAFDKYGTVTVYPFYYGGMEHQTMVTQNRMWIRDNGDVGFVHEMGHHWFGDMMTCATWADVWINEGGASFTEAMYYGELDSTLYRYLMLEKVKYYLTLNEQNFAGSSYAVPVNLLFGAAGFLIYDRAAIIFNQLKLNVGDDEFYRVLKEILQDWKYKSITTDEFRQAWKEKAQNPLVDIDTFFNQWIYGAGHPEYRISTSLKGMESGKYEFEINLEQVQSLNASANKKVSELYITPVRFELKNGDSTYYSDLFMNNKMNQSFDLLLDYIPTSVDIDQLSVVHKTLTSTITSVELPDYVGEIELYPNPALQGYSQLNLNIKNNVQNAKIKLLDLLGNKIKTIYNGNLYTGSIGYKIFTNGLAKGIYIVNINLDGINSTKKLIVQ